MNNELNGRSKLKLFNSGYLPVLLFEVVDVLQEIKSLRVFEIRFEMPTDQTWRGGKIMRGAT